MLSVVIPTCARPAELARCLERLAPDRQPGFVLVADHAATESAAGAAAYEVIVTDDSPAGTSAEALVRSRFPWARWLAGPRRGPAANRNHGAAHARGDWLVFTDDDCLPGPGWLAAFAAATAGNDEVLEGRTTAAGPQPDPLAQCPVNETGGLLWSCNLAIRTGRFRALGGFDERFPFATMEDIEFLLRVEKSGLRPRFVPAAHVVHPWKQVRYLDLRRRQVRSQLLLRELHPEQRSSISLPMHLRRTARFYFFEFAAGLRRFGWRQLATLPVVVCDQAQTAWLLAVAPAPGGRRRPAAQQA